MDLPPHRSWHLCASCRVDNRWDREREPWSSSAKGEIEPVVGDPPSIPFRERQRAVVLLAPWGTSLHTVLAIGPIGHHRFVEVVGNDLSGVGMEWAILWGDGGEEGLDVVLAWRPPAVPLTVDPIHGLVPENGRVMGGVVCPAVIAARQGDRNDCHPHGVHHGRHTTKVSGIDVLFMV